MTTPFDVCVVGSANLDLVATAARHPGPGETVLGTGFAEHAGGKGLNQAVAAARAGARTAFVGALGTDDAGARLLGVLRDDGIDHTLVARCDEPTGRALIVVDATGENSIVVVPGANHTVVATDPPPTRAVLAQLEIPLDAVVGTFRRAGDSIRVLNPAPATELPPELVALCDVIVPNEHEVALLGGVDALLAAGCGAVVTTRGGDGVDVADRDGVEHVEPFDVDVVDTTGAGDAFCGTLAARLAAGFELDDAVVHAAAAGALATTIVGAVPAQPTAAAIARLVNGTD